MTDATLLQRIERIEAQLAIQQLPARYAVSVDARDLDALAALFVEDVDVGRRGKGREALKAFYDSDNILRAFYRSIHQICGHVIDLIDANHATGKVYCRAEHEDGGHWVVMAICYFDTYERRDGRWYFKKRDEQHWYSTDWLARPGVPQFQNWPGKYTSERFQPRLPESFPTWGPFWERSKGDKISHVSHAASPQLPPLGPESAMNKIVAPLFDPLKIRSVTLRNRIVMAPMTRNFSPDGVPGPDVAAYYRRRAEGEAGLIITEGVGVDHPAALGEAGIGETDLPRMYDEAALAGWKQVVEEVHAAGGVIFPQLWHQGVMRVQGTGPHPEVRSCRPSGIWGPPGGMTSSDPAYVEKQLVPTEPMSEKDIENVIAAYGRSAAYAKKLGFDGIAIHGAHGYLIDTFLWAETNRRTDVWGGDRKARSRFAAEVVKAIRSAVGPELPIIFRFSQWKQQHFKARLAETPQELEEILGPIADAGVDVFDASVRYFNRAEFPGSDLNLAGWAKKVTGKPSMTVGGVGLNNGMYDSRERGGADPSNNLDLVMQRFNRGEFDLVGVGRSLLHDPNWTRRARLGEPFLPFEEASLKVLT